MLFGNRQINRSVKIIINDVEIERVHESKCLGVIIDHKLCWKLHINNVKTKIPKSIAILHRFKHILTQKSLHIWYNCLIVPYNTYCVEIWGNTYKTNINPVYLLQKKSNTSRKSI